MLKNTFFNLMTVWETKYYIDAAKKIMTHNGSLKYQKQLMKWMSTCPIHVQPYSKYYDLEIKKMNFFDYVPRTKVPIETISDDYYFKVVVGYDNDSIYNKITLSNCENMLYRYESKLLEDVDYVSVTLDIYSLLHFYFTDKDEQEKNKEKVIKIFCDLLGYRGIKRTKVIIDNDVLWNAIQYFDDKLHIILAMDIKDMKNIFKFKNIVSYFHYTGV